MKTINIYRSAAPGVFGVGWARDDIPGVVHQFSSTKSGECIEVSDGRGGPHWPCEVCDDHGYTREMFEAQIEDALLRGPENHK